MYSFKPSLKAAQSVILLLVITLTTLVTACSSITSEPVGSSIDSIDIHKSPNDSREYRAFTLDNGLSVFLIHDANTKKAAASLDIAIGSGSDPDNREGLAHFLEHMLFLGTAKYPDAAEYSRYITNHGGYNNAFTTFEDTNYHFDVEAEFLEPALDRFAQFFISPLFEEDLVEREKNAVHSEFSAKRREDGRRVWDARRQAINPDHPISRFPTGSLETLADRGESKIREELIAFYEKFYSANIMTLSVYGGESLDQLEALVRSKFEAVPNRKSSVQKVNVPMYDITHLPRRLDVQALKDQRNLVLSFELDHLPEYRDTKPHQLVSSLLGHEGEGSLLSALKRRGHADSLSASASMSERGLSLFNITIGLTPDGFQHVDEIVGMVFATIELIKREGIKKRYHDEQKRLADINFRFREKGQPSSMVQYAARQLHDWPAADLLVGPSEIKRFDPSHMVAVLEQLKPQRLMLTVVSPDAHTNQVSRFYETPYSLHSIDAALVEQWSKAQPLVDIQLPSENPFIPGNLDLVAERNTVIPVELDVAEGVELWHKTDTSFKVPRANLYVSFRSNSANSSARNAVLSELFVRLMKERLNESAYPAALAGLNFDVFRHLEGFGFYIFGYSDGQELILKRILDALKEPEFTQQQFVRIRDDLIREIKDSRKRRPFGQTISQVQELLREPYWSDVAQIEAAGRISVSEVTRHASILMKDVAPLVLSHGNVTKYASITRAKLVRNYLAQIVPASELDKVAVVKLKNNDRIGRNLSIEHNDSAVTLYMQTDNNDVVTRARLALLSQILAQPFYNEIRTKQQLGYFVSASRQYVMEVPGFRFSIQSPQASPEKMIGRIQQFIVGFRDELKRMTPEEFSRHRKAVISLVVEPARRLLERSQRYWREIYREEYGFDSREQFVSAINASTQADIIQMYEELLMEKTRGRVVSWSRGKLATETDTSLQVELPEHYESLEKFVAEREMFLLTVPHSND